MRGLSASTMPLAMACEGCIDSKQLATQRQE